MIPRRPPPPRGMPEESLVPEERVLTASGASSRASIVQELNDDPEGEALTVLGQSPTGLPCVEQRSVQNYVSLFETLLAESLDARAPGFDDAVDSLVSWFGQEEAQKVEALERGQKQLTELREQNYQLNADLNEYLEDRGSTSSFQNENAKLRAECAEYHAAVNQLEQDLLDRLADNENLVKTIETLRQKIRSQEQSPQEAVMAPPRAQEDPPSSPPPEMTSRFIFADSFAKEAELSESLLRADILAVNKGDPSEVNWSEAFQDTVNKDEAKCLKSRKPWRNLGRLHNSGLSVLHIAALIGSPSLVKAWLGEGLDCCSTDSRGNTVLHWCFMSEHMKSVGLGFMGDEAMTVIVTLCDYLRETENLDSLLTLIFTKNRSGLALVSEHGVLNDELVRSSPILMPVKNYLSEAIQYITTHQSAKSLKILPRRFDWSQYSVLLSHASFRIAPEDRTQDEDPSKKFMLLINLDQKKDNLLSYRVTRPELRFGDESVVNYSLLGCDQLGYLQHPDYKRKINPSAHRTSTYSARGSQPLAASLSQAGSSRLGFSTVGKILSFHPCIERQWAHIVIIGDSLYIHSESAAFMDPNKRKSDAPFPISQMEAHSLRRLKLLHVLEGYESMILLRFSYEEQSEQQNSFGFSSDIKNNGDLELPPPPPPPTGNVFDLVVETEFKPHFILAICVHYYTFCKPLIPTTYSSGTVNVLAPPICVDLNNYNVIPIYYGERTPIAAIIMTRFPHSNVLGECMVVSCRASFVTVPRYFSGFKKVATVSYISNLEEAINSCDDNSGEGEVRPTSIETIGQSALCILHDNMLLELYATPLDDAEYALFRLDLNPATSFIRAIPFDSDYAVGSGHIRGSRQSVATVTSSIFTHLSKLLDLTQVAAETWYAIKFQEAKDEKTMAAAAIGFGIKEERDDWMCLLHSEIK